MLESSADGPPNVLDNELLEFEIWASEHSEMSTGVFRLEVELLEENKRSLDEEDASETLGVVYILLHPVYCWKENELADIVDICWGSFG